MSTESIDLDEIPERKGVIRMEIFKTARVGRAGRELKRREVSHRNMEGSGGRGVWEQCGGRGRKTYLDAFL